MAQISAILADVKRRPNLFLIAPRILSVEGIHSDLLTWMLDPAGWHGLNDSFMVAFVREVLETCGRPNTAPIRIDSVDSEISTGQGPIDILVHLHLGDTATVLGIENKIHSPEGDRQLKRYGDALMSRYGRDRVTLAFVTPDGRKPKETLPACPVASISYGRVASLLEHALEVAGTEGVGPQIVRQYIGAVRTHVMSESNAEIDTLCRTLLDEHKDAWRAIRRRLPSQRDDGHAAIARRVCEWLQAEHGAWRLVVRRDRYACVFRDDWFSLGAFSADSLVDVGEKPAANVGYPRVHFRLVADGSDSDADTECRYALRLKVDQREEANLGRELIDKLRAIETLRSKIPDRDQWTVTLKSTANLPALSDESMHVPDRVVEWYARNLLPFVPAIDSVLRRRKTPRRRP